MSKRRRKNGIRSKSDVYEEQGRGAEYRPALLIQDVPSLGRVTRHMGIKTGRQHSLMSDLERNLLYYLEFSDDVVDIREQFPLCLAETKLIAEECGIEHPTHPKTGEVVTMTSDFCITLRNGNDIIRTVKPKSELMNKRVIEKFEIERRYWQSHGLKWGIVTDQEIDKIFALNLKDILAYHSLKSRDGLNELTQQDLTDIILYITQQIFEANKTGRKIASEVEQRFSLEIGTGIALIKYMIARKYIEINLHERLNFSEILVADATTKGLSLSEEGIG